MARFGDTQIIQGYTRPRDMDGAYADYGAAFEAFDEGMFGDCHDPSIGEDQPQEVIIIPNKSAGPSPALMVLGGFLLAKLFL